MATIRAALFSGCVLLAAAAATAASAGTFVITDVQAGNSDFGNVHVGPYGNPWTTPILVTDSTGQTTVVFCDDLQHDIDVTGGQHLLYHTGLVTTNGLGHSISEAVSNEMGQLADIGRFDFTHGDDDGAMAAQAEIWGLEYNTSASSTDKTIEADITKFANTIHNNGEGYATGFIANGDTQSLIYGGVPEPATWAMLILGVAMIGAAARRRRQFAFGAIAA